MKNIITRAIIVFTTLITFVSCSNDFDIDKDGGIRWVVEVNKTEPLGSSNPDVGYEAAVQRTEQIIKTRLDNFVKREKTSFHKIKYHVKQSDEPGRIIIELSLNKDNEAYEWLKYRTMHLISATGYLELWETYNYDELRDCLYLADSTLAESNLYADSKTPRYPLYGLLLPYSEGPVMGHVHIKDTATINKMLYETRDLFPNTLKMTWSTYPNREPEYLDLVALKIPDDKQYAVNGSYIIDAEIAFGQELVFDEVNRAGIEVQMNEEEARKMKRITENNIGRDIAIVTDGNVYNFYNTKETDEGHYQIFGNMSIEENLDLANVIKNGKFPFRVNIIEEKLVEPQQAR